MEGLGNQENVELDPKVEQRTVIELGRRDKKGISADSAAPLGAAELQLKAIRAGRNERRTPKKVINFLLGKKP